MKGKGIIGCFFMVVVMFSLIVQIPTASADPDILKVLGSGEEKRTISYSGHEVAYGFATDICIAVPVKRYVVAFTQACFAVSLANGWMDWHTFYTPYVGKMWVNIQGTPESYSFYEIIPNAIVDNTGTGGGCTISWETLLSILDIVLNVGSIVLQVYQTPPQIEWQGGPPQYPHYAKAVVRQSLPPYYAHRILQTGACDFFSLFHESGPQHLEITAKAEIWLQKDQWTRWGDYVTNFKVGEYEFSFQVSVPVDITIDLNNDGIIDITDISICSIAYLSMPYDNPDTPGDENANWNAIADVNNDGFVDIVDIAMIARHFGETV